jgi:hypothetical protein
LSLNNKTKSILLQVAFKAAVEVEKDAALVEEKAQIFYEQLLALHDKYGIADQSTGDGGSTGPSAAAVAEEDAPETVIGGVAYKDFRGLKAIPGTDLAPNFPDFKLGAKGYWLTKKDGSPTKFAIDNGLTATV